MSYAIDFESTLAELEKVVNELDGDIKLERALELFEQGVKLSSACEIFLQSAEQKVEILRRTARGLITEPFEPANDAEAATANR
jgi:exodeoxyribonuclease VII small subunit